MTYKLDVFVVDHTLNVASPLDVRAVLFIDRLDRLGSCLVNDRLKSK